MSETTAMDLFHPKKAELEKAAKECKDLKIDGIDDKAGYEAVHQAQMKLVKFRTGITGTCKEYTDQFEKKKKDAWVMRDELLDIISTEEADLKAKKKAIDDEKERKKEEEDRKIQEETDKKLRALADVGVTIDLFDLQLLNDEQYKTKLTEATEKFKKDEELRQEADRKRLREEEEAAVINGILRAETIEDLEKIKEKAEKNGLIYEGFEKDFNNKKGLIEYEENKKKLDADQKKLDDEKAKIESDKQEKIRKEAEDKRVEDAKKEAAASAKKEAEDKVKKDEENRIAKEKSDKEAEEKRKKEEEQKLSKQKIYKDFLTKNGITQNLINSGDIIREIDEENKTVTFYKKIDTFSN